MASFLILIAILAFSEASIMHRTSRQQFFDLNKIYKMMEEIVEMSRTLENNIKDGSINMGGSKMTGGNIENIMASWGDDKALQEAKSAFILAKTSSATIEQCKMTGMNYNNCLDEMSRMDVVEYTNLKCNDDKYRSPDGVCNNLNNPEWGASYSPYSRVAGTSSYHDGIWFTDIVYNKNYPDPLNVSADLLDVMDANIHDVTFGFSSWSNLVNNDLSHTASYRNLFTKQNIQCCRENGYRVLPRYCHPLCLYMNGPEDTCVSYARSMLAVSNDKLSPAEQMNTATHFLDASNIYGSNSEVESAIRVKSNGLLKELTSNEIIEVPINCVETGKCFVTGDLRNLLEPGSAIGYILLIKEHNRIAKVMNQLNPDWKDEKLFQEAKRILIAELQHITYNEWLPLVIGRKKYNDKSLNLQVSGNGYSNLYNKKIDPSVSNEFANAALKPLTWLNEIFLRQLNKERNKLNMTSLRHSMINFEELQNNTLLQELGMSLPMRMASNKFLFSDKMIGILYSEDNDNTQIKNLALDIHRGRDHGLLPFFKYGEQMNFEQNIEQKNTQMMNKYYKNKHFDLLSGGIMEEKVKKAMVGKTFQEIISRQMSSTRMGDKFFYDNSDQPYPFTLSQLNEIKKSTFARLVCDNFNTKEIQISAFLPTNERNPLVLCNDEKKLKIVNLRYWQE